MKRFLCLTCSHKHTHTQRHNDLHSCWNTQRCLSCRTVCLTSTHTHTHIDVRTHISYAHTHTHTDASPAELCVWRAHTHTEMYVLISQMHTHTHTHTLPAEHVCELHKTHISQLKRPSVARLQQLLTEVLTHTLHLREGREREREGERERERERERQERGIQSHFNNRAYQAKGVWMGTTVISGLLSAPEYKPHPLNFF